MTALAQWQWLDKDGRKVYSDRPPPLDTPEKNILKQPGVRPGAAPVAAPPPAAPPPASTASAPANAAAAAAAPAPRPAGKDAALEEKKKQAEQAEAARQQAEQEKFQKTRADNCARARQAKAGFDSGARIATTNKAGERIILDDDARAAETKRLQNVIQSECN